MASQWVASCAAMTIDELAQRMRAAKTWVPGKRVQLEFRGEGSILLDGVAGEVTTDAGAADTIISATWEDWKALAEGQLDPIGAFMNGRLRVDGDLSAAMQLQALLGRALSGGER